MDSVFNYEKALERFMGEKEILLEVITPYIENLNKNIEELKSLDLKSQIDRVRDLTHSIKGSSLNLEIVALGTIAEKIEEFAYNKKVKKVAELMPELFKASQEAILELNKYI